MNRSWVGTCVDFRGFDERHYTAHVDSIRKGIATLTYVVRGKPEPVKAYVDRATWNARVNQPRAS